MNNRFITKAVAIIIALITSFASFAQERIDKEVARLEKDSNVDVTYTERRNPKTKKIERQSIILNGNSKVQAQQLWRAFEAERENSISVTKKRNQSFIMKFEDKKYHASYVLTVNDSNWSLVITKREPGADENDFSYNVNGDCFNDLTFNGLELLDHFEQLNNLYKLNDLDGLNDLDKLNNLEGKSGSVKVNGDVTVYDSNGNVIYRKVGNKCKDAAKSEAKKSAKSKSKTTSKTRTVTTTSHDGTSTTITYNI
ncbi:MAG: DUF5024 domain-containing protein [Muribaculaceae bacterium]|nr:DUF5024 domain-containing protein [Muribaculaceae bacterium]